MFLYKGSKLESDIKKLTEEARKTDYQKAIEPYQQTASDLRYKLYRQQEDMKALLYAASMLLKSLDNRHIKVAIFKSPPTARLYSPDYLDMIEEVDVISIPVGQELINDFYRALDEYQKKYRPELVELGSGKKYE